MVKIEDIPFYLFSAVFALCMTVVHSQSLDCDFEAGLCSWVTPPTSDRNWTRSNRKSASPRTGPDTGHTSPEYNYYIYLYAEDFKNQNNLIDAGRCVLLSPPFNTSQSGGCFRFWYHMLGLGVGNLTVEVLGQAPFTKVGQNGSSWNCGHISLEENRAFMKIQVTATTGPNIQGDIALDDFIFFPQRCQTLSDPCADTASTTLSTEGSTGATTQSFSSTDDQVSETMTATTTEQPDGVSEVILYIAIVPMVILIIGGLVAFCIYRNRKSKQEEDASSFANALVRSPAEPGDTMPQEDNGEEEYAYIDETAIDADLTVITDPNQPNHRGTYRSNSGIQNEGFDDEDGYVQPVNGPFASNGKLPSEALDESDSVMRTENAETMNPNIDGVGGQFEGARETQQDMKLYSNEKNPSPEWSAVNGRREPPDDDGDRPPPPPKCGPTSGYIRAIHTAL